MSQVILIKDEGSYVREQVVMFYEEDCFPAKCIGPVTLTVISQDDIYAKVGYFFTPRLPVLYDRMSKDMATLPSMH
jgi:hypothetical protein